MAPKRRAAAAAKEPAQEGAAAAPAKRTRRPAGGGKAGGKAAAAAPAAAAAAPATAAAAAAGSSARAAAAAAAGSSAERPGFYLMKSEPDVFSVDDLEKRPNQTEPWDGVRSHQAKKVLQGMRRGDRAFFYHSNAKPPGIVGIVEVVREQYPDPSQFDPASEYYDASSKPDAPKWCCVDVKLVRRLAQQIPLEELKGHAGGALQDMALFKYSRLSVQPVTAQQWEFVLGLEGQGE